MARAGPVGPDGRWPAARTDARCAREEATALIACGPKVCGENIECFQKAAREC